MKITLNDQDLTYQILQTITQGDHPGAITLLEEALSQFPTDSQLYYLLGAEYA